MCTCACTTGTGNMQQNIKAKMQQCEKFEYSTMRKGKKNNVKKGKCKKVMQKLDIV
jgi:hypothetical protein